jgi:hypothetical protein
MWDRLCDFWLPRLLFAVTVAVAGALAGVVVLAPWLDGINQSGLLALFARDAVVRRTTLASAVGLVVTAYVFFRPGGFVFLRSQKDKSRTPPPMAGA